MAENENKNTTDTAPAVDQTTKHKRRRHIYTEAEAAAHVAAADTQGRRGLKATRINLAFTAEGHEYVRIMSRIRGETIAEFVDVCLMEHRERNKDIYGEAVKLIDMMEARRNE